MPKKFSKMKPEELAKYLTTKQEFKPNTCYDFRIGWDNGKLEYALFNEVHYFLNAWPFCSEYEALKREVGDLGVPRLSNRSKGCLGVKIFIEPCENIELFETELAAAISKAIEKYSKQLNEELEETNKAIKLLNELK